MDLGILLHSIRKTFPHSLPLSLNALFSIYQILQKWMNPDASSQFYSAPSLFPIAISTCAPKLLFFLRLALLTSTNWSACVSQNLTQAGSPSQNSHLIISFLIKSYEMAPNGQACKQSLQPMQSDKLSLTNPNPEFRDRAFTGQTVTHAGSSHWRHNVGICNPSHSQRMILILALSGLQAPVFMTEQTVSHSLHPVHLV